MNFLKAFALGIILCLFISCGSKERKQSPNKESYSLSELKGFENRPFFFYNVENLFDTIDDPHKNDDDFLPESAKKWNSKRYYDKLEKLAEVLSFPTDNPPLFMGFAEIETKAVVEDLVKTGKLAAGKYGVVHFDSPDNRGIDVALAYDQQRMIIVHQEAVSVTLEDEPTFKTRDILYAKALFKDGLELHVFVNHWPSRRGGDKQSEYKRIVAAQRLLHKTDSIQKADIDPKILIMGDFNDYPTNRSIREVLGAGTPNISNDFINLMLEIHQEGKGSFNFRGSWGALDQFIVTPNLISNHEGLHIEGYTAHIVNDDKFLHFYKDGNSIPSKTYGGDNYFGGYSDHLAIYGFLENLKKK